MIARTVLLLSCVFGGGCSYAFVKPAPPNYAQRVVVVDCTSSRLAPIVDVGGALESVVSVALVEDLSHTSLTGESPHRDVTTEARVMEVLLVGLAAVQVASAAYGFRKTSECERAETEWRVRLAQPPPPRPGCTDDAACKNGRRCMQGLCVWPVTP